MTQRAAEAHGAPEAAWTDLLGAPTPAFAERYRELAGVELFT